MQNDTTVDGGPVPGIAVSVEEGAILAIVRAADRLTRLGDMAVFGADLSQAQFNILMILKREGQHGMSQKEIVERLVTTKGNVSIHIGNLSRAGYIHRRTSRADSRRHVITLTAKGRRILGRVEPKYLRQLGTITRGIDPGELAVVERVLGELESRCGSAMMTGHALGVET